MKSIPAFGGPWGGERGRLERLNKQAAASSGQRPRVIQVACSCGCEIPITTEVYTEHGEQELRAKFAKHPCGVCVESYHASDSLRRRNEHDRERDRYLRSLERAWS